MLSNATFSKSDMAMIAILIACATATMIESHNRVVIDPPASIDSAVSAPAVKADLVCAAACEPTPALDHLTAP
jgi:hypothetical protein